MKRNPHVFQNVGQALFQAGRDHAVLAESALLNRIRGLLGTPMGDHLRAVQRKGSKLILFFDHPQWVSALKPKALHLAQTLAVEPQLSGVLIQIALFTPPNASTVKEK